MSYCRLCHTLGYLCHTVGCFILYKLCHTVGCLHQNQEYVCFQYIFFCEIMMYNLIYVSTQSRNGRLFTLNEIPKKKKKEFEVCFFLCVLLQLLDAQQPDSITTQVCRND